MFAASKVLLDFYVSDNDGLYTLFTLAAVGLAIVLIVTVAKQSRASDRRLHHLSATKAPTEETQSSETPL